VFVVTAISTNIDIKTVNLVTKFSYLVTKRGKEDYPLKNSFILNLGATIYVYNDYNRFSVVRKASNRSFLLAREDRI
jgi:Ni/Fe-hydrogenase subunit HybB-like protein